MWALIDLITTSLVLWLYLETSWILLVSLVYFTVPWLVWGAIVIYLAIRFIARIPPPSVAIVKKVIGVDPATYTSTEDGSIKETDNDEDFCLRVIAHRGAGFDYPENSLSAFRNSRERGCAAIEFDLALTKDNVPILFHDVTIDRLTGFNGTIKDMTWSELKDYDISANHPLRIKFGEKGEKIPLFDEVLEDSLQSFQRMFIDIKATNKEIVNVVTDAFKKHPELYERAAITSFNPIIIYLIRKKDPKIVAGMAWRPRFFSTTNYNGLKGPNQPRFDRMFKQIVASTVDIVHDWALERITYYILGLSFILLHKDVISPDVIHRWNKRGVRVLAWTVNLPTEKTHFEKNLKVSYLTDTLLS